MTRFRRSRRGIKICETVSGFSFSAFHDGKVVGYKLGKWTERPEKCGPLAVFNNLISAMDFLSAIKWDNGSKKYFKCKYKESNETKLYVPRRSNGYNSGYYERTILPEGTVFGDRVKIIKEVK